MTDIKPVVTALGRAFPELQAGGYSRRDGTVEFYSRLRSLINGREIVLDFGAGRGSFMEDPVAMRRDLVLLRGKVAEVIGVDVDPVVLQNASLDSAIVIGASPPYPLEDEQFDMIVSDWTFEHLDEPNVVIKELDRVLRPGGWICARTPYRWGSIGLATNLIPNRRHVPLLKRLQPGRERQDVFPTRYRLNTKTAVARQFGGWRNCSYLFTPEPAYLATSRPALALGRVIDALLPGPVLMIFVQKPE
jgi:SAM-dependent methyltransferase